MTPVAAATPARWTGGLGVAACAGLLARMALFMAIFAALLLPERASAEKGALRFEPALIAQATLLRAPGETGDSGGGSLTLMPKGGLSVRYALSHDVSVGLAAGIEPWRWLSHEEVTLSLAGGDAPLVGRMVYSYSSLSVAAVARIYLTGFNFRLHVEPLAGWARRRYRNLDHLQLLEDGRSMSYGLRIEPFSTNDLLLGAGMGIEHVWDRASVGVAARAAALLGGDSAIQGGLILYAAVDLYP